MSVQCIPETPKHGTAPLPDSGDAPTILGNRLAGETSPYLLQHRNNPVHWMPWGPEALALARQTGKPILLSVGYAACHWCHVMAHESFENPEIAALMNELFVNIKVDREERPDVDALYQHALALMGEHGGWPLTMFLTPETDPIWGSTYLPPAPRFGRPGFPEVLRQIARIYRDEPDKVRQNVAALRGALAGMSDNQAGKSLAPDFLERTAANLLPRMDKRHGGIGGAPKFPQTPALELLWRAYRRNANAAYRDIVCLSLDRMCQGGIYDHLGGGFSRYAVDESWLVPHFEKMLYDNAQLIDLLTLVWQETRAPLYARRIRETIDWALREMRVEGAAFAGSLDADSEGEEGRYYVWREEEIDRLLASDASFFKDSYDVTPGGNWEGKTILNRSRLPALGDDAHEARLEACRETLFAAREARARPGLDDKVLADWNGLMIAALANAGLVFDEPRWVEAGAAAFAFVRQRMDAEGRLLHSWRAGRAAHPATLDDYAHMCRAALALHEATGETGYIEAAEGWLVIVERHYGDPESGGYYFSADDVDDLIARSRTAFDNAAPAGNAVLAAVLARLFYLTGQDDYRARAAALIAAFSGDIERTAPAMTTLINADDQLANGIQIVIRGAPGEAAEAGVEALRRAVLGVSLPNRVLQVPPPEAELPEGHPARGKGPAGDGRAAAYVCRGPVCSLPLSDPDALIAALKQIRVD